MFHQISIKFGERIPVFGNVRGMRHFVKRLRQGGLLIVGIILIVFNVFPVVWTALFSIKTNLQIYEIPPPIFFTPTLKNWQAVLLTGHFGHFYANTLIICISTVILVLIVATMAAYALSRFKFEGKERFAFFILSQRMMPAVAIVLPMYIIFGKVGLLDTLEGLILIDVAFNLPVGIWMLRSFIDTIPIELEEQALVDGCNRLGAFFRVGLPLALGGILATGVIIFINTVNEFFFAFVLTGGRAAPLAVLATHYLPAGSRETLYGNAGVASILIMLPSLVLSIIVQRHLIRGMSMGALKA